MPVSHLLRHNNYTEKVLSVANDELLAADSANAGAIVRLKITNISGIPAANIPFAPVGAITQNEVQAALAGLDTRITNLSSVGARNAIVGRGVPAAGLGEDGEYYLDADTGDWYGAKAAGAWGGAFANAFAQLGLTSTPAADPAAAAVAGVDTLAARADHRHKFQSAADTPTTAIVGITGGNTQAVLAELAARVAETLQQTTAAGNTTSNDIEFTGPAGFIMANGGTRRRYTMGTLGELIGSDPL